MISVKTFGGGGLLIEGLGRERIAFINESLSAFGPCGDAGAWAIDRNCMLHLFDLADEGRRAVNCRPAAEEMTSVSASGLASRDGRLVFLLVTTSSHKTHSTSAISWWSNSRLVKFSIVITALTFHGRTRWLSFARVTC